MQISQAVRYRAAFFVDCHQIGERRLLIADEFFYNRFARAWEFREENF